MNFIIAAEVDATEMFGDESVDWQYCMAHATFSHTNACEFMFHCAEQAYAESKQRDMKAAGCSAEFMAAYREAAESGATWVIFYA